MKRLHLISLIFAMLFGINSLASIDSLKTVLANSSDDSTSLALNVQIGWEFLGKQQPDAALEYAKDAEKIAKRIQDPLQAETVYKLMAFCYGDLNDRPNCLNNHLTRVKLLESHGEVNRPLVIAYYEIASVFDSQEQDSTAIEYYLKCQVAAKEVDFLVAYGLTLMPMARIKEGNGDIEGAKKDLVIAMSVLRNQPLYHAMAISDYSAILIDQDSLVKAGSYIDTALSIITPYKEEHIGFVYQNAGKIELKKGSNNRAVGYFRKALDVWEPLHKNFYLQGLYLLLAESYTTIDPDSSAHYYKKHIELRDVVNNEDNNAQMANMEAKYENQKKEQEIALLSKDKELGELEKQKQEQIFMVVLAGLGLVLVLVIFLATKLRKISNQNKLIQRQKLEVQHQKEIVEAKSQELGDSINYAMRIQNAALPEKSSMKEGFEESFVIYKAKDKLSGDFYWRGNINGSDNEQIHLVALGDCTGHGVPGALLSILGINYLNVGLSANQLKSPAIALDFLNNGIHATFSSSEGEIRDGMDMAIVAINRSKMTMTYACAKNPVYIIRNGELIVLKGDKHAVGKDGASNEIVPFNNFEVDIKKGDIIYLFSDGFADQFGGDKGKKMGYKRFKEKLLSLEGSPLSQQEKDLSDNFENWKGSLEQLDDVCLIGLKI